MKNIKPPSRSDANKIALFKGKYIAQFLNLEYGLERIIVRFFQEQYKIGVHGLTSAMNEMSEIAKRNENVATFSFLFAISLISFIAEVRPWTPILYCS